MTDKFEDQRFLRAADIVENPEIVEKIRGMYQMIGDLSMKGMFHNLDRAIKIMAENGWRASGITVASGAPDVAMVLMERVSK